MKGKGGKGGEGGGRGVCRLMERGRKARRLFKREEVS